MTAPLSFLSEALTVKAVEDGRVAVTVLLPPDLVTDYCRFLESLASFFHNVDRKSSFQLAQARAESLTLQADLDNINAVYRSRLVVLFDTLTAQGCERKEAVKRVAAQLRSESHPWCCVDLVRSELVAAGRGGRSGRPRQVVP